MQITTPRALALLVPLSCLVLAVTTVNADAVPAQTVGQILLVDQDGEEGPGLALIDPWSGHRVGVDVDTDLRDDLGPMTWVDDHTVRRLPSDGGFGPARRIDEIDLVSGQVRTLHVVGDETSEYVGALSPDGRRATIVRRLDPMQPWGAHELWALDLDSGEQHLVVDGVRQHVSDHAWSPDGSFIAHVQEVPGGSVLEVVDVAGGGEQRIPLPGERGRFPSFSPDGHAVALHVEDDGGASAGSEVRVISLRAPSAGTVVVRQSGLVAGPRPAWRPDGRGLAVALVGIESGTEDQLVVVELAPDGSVASEWVRPLDDAGSTLAWTPDGRWLAMGTVLNDSGCHCPIGATTIVSPETGQVVLDEEVLLGAPAPALGVTRRVAGPDRIITAIEVSRRVHAHAGEAVLARADLYPDALAGGPFAAAVAGPLLLTRSGTLDEGVAGEIQRLGVSRVHLLGSEEALSRDVASALEDLGVEVIRHGGPNRFATAAAIADGLGARAGGTVYLVEGQSADPRRGWPDAISASALAARDGRPLLLTLVDRLPSPTESWLRAHAHEVDRVVVVGGVGAVSEEVAQAAAAAAGADLERIAGVNRYETSFAVARRAIAGGARPETGWLATGTNWPDALVAGPGAARTGGWLVLSPPADLDEGDPAWSLFDGATSSTRTHLVGGPDVLGPAVAVAVERRVP